MAFAIAAEVFRKIPRHFQYGKYPESCKFGNFSLSYEKDLAEMVTETDFLHTNDTETMWTQNYTTKTGKPSHN